MLKMFSNNIYSIMNFSIIVCTFIESYVFPFSILKWIVIVAKYGHLIKLLNRRNGQIGLQCRSKFKYNLELKTITNVEPNLSSHVSVLMETESGLCNWMQLSYCGQDCKRIPPGLWRMYGPKVQYLDLSYNSLETISGLEQFPRLEDLILDNNKLTDGVSFPRLPALRTLSLNNNQISDLEGLLNKIDSSFPALTYLSLLSNKACPNQLSDADKDESDYQRYRYFVIHKLRNLRFLDSRRVTSSEWREAMTRGEFMRVRRPRDVTDAHDVTARQEREERQRPLPVDFAALGKHKGAYGKCHYRYTGKHSEGNRFIVNSDL